jgi:hypothetical protein
VRRDHEPVVVADRVHDGGEVTRCRLARAHRSAS